jgi:hypothetical protein
LSLIKRNFFAKFCHSIRKKEKRKTNNKWQNFVKSITIQAVDVYSFGMVLYELLTHEAIAVRFFLTK